MKNELKRFVLQPGQSYSAAIAVGLALMSVPMAGRAQTPEISNAAAISKGGFMVPKAVELRQMTPSEEQAHAIWTLRAALNVGALQCQYSPFLRTVKNYNEMLRLHSSELARAQAVIVGHFRRYDGRAALGNFDRYTTRMYNSFSTLDAQYSFCEAVGVAGRQSLFVQRGLLGNAARTFNPMLRTALAEPPPKPEFDVGDISGYSVPTLVLAPEEDQRRRRRL